MSPAAGPSIGIVGAGIGGLTAANALIRRGFVNVRVYDQAPHFISTVGAGFGLSPNGQLCLSSIGIEEYKDVLHPFHFMTRMKKNGDLKLSSPTFKDLYDKFGFGIAGCLRADLIDILAKPLASNLHYSHKMVSIAQDDKKVHVSFENGVQEEFDLVIGADGINSTVSNLLQIDPSPPIYSGANIIYGVIPNPDSVSFENPILRQANNMLIQGPGQGEITMYRCGPEERKTQIWALTYRSASPPKHNAQEWEKTGGQTKSHLDQILKDVPLSHPLHEVSRHTPPERLLHFGMSYRKHKELWSKGRVCLLGDACHATLPYIGQGANQAIEDAIVLADCLQRNSEPDGGDVDYESGYQQFYDKRSTRTRRVVQLGNFLNKLYHSRNPITQAFLDWFLTSMAKGGFVFKQLEREILDECPVDYKTFQSIDRH